jgi:serine/threonine-protein kinase RsbT
MPEEIHVAINSESDIITARQKGREVALGLGFGNMDLTLLATAISEVARNIVKYAGRGEIVVWTAVRIGGEGIVVQARDKGPGIADLEMAMRDGFSTGNGLGLGLPGARRLVDEFEIQSSPGEGTVVTLKKWARKR